MPASACASSDPLLAVLLRAAALLAVGGTLGFAVNWVRPGGVPFGHVEKVAICEAADPDELVVVSPDDGAALCAEVGAIVLDVRSEEAFARGHVAGALHLPCHADPLGGDVSGILTTAGVILVYGESTEEARPVAQSLLQRQFTDVRILEGGYAAWEAAGQGCVSGPCESCEEGHE